MKCIYHNDMDGRCAGSLVAKFTENYNPENYIEADYKEFPIDKILPDETVYIVDYAFTKDTVHHLDNLVNQMHCDVIWIDHHTSSVNLAFDAHHKWIMNINGIRCSHLSGAGLVYVYFMKLPPDPEVLPRYIQYVDDYDRWIYRLGDDTIYFKVGIETLDFDALDPIWTELHDFNEKCDSIIDVGKTVKRYIDKDNNFYINSYGYESELLGHRCYVVNKKSNSWIFGDKINEYPFVVAWVFDGVDYQYSIFSSDESIDCSRIAEKFGGGGHKGAAGFRSKEKIL